MKSQTLPHLCKSLLLAVLLSCAPGFAHAGPTMVASFEVQNDTPAPTVLASNTTTAKTTPVKSVSGYPKFRPAAGVPVFIFNPKTRMWAVYNASGTLLKVGVGSAGRNYCPDIHRGCRTPTGVFHIIAKQGASCKSSKYPVGKGGAPMPYCSFFTKYHGIHGSYEVRNYNASHGCIRVHPADAKWIQSVMPIGSIVIVKPY